jgi:hypothetical protein
MIWLLAPPPQYVKTATHMKNEKERQAADGRGVERGAESCDCKNAWSSINLSIHSALRYCRGRKMYSTKVTTRLNTQYNVHILIGTGWQICQQMTPGFLPKCWWYIFARYSIGTVFIVVDGYVPGRSVGHGQGG